MTDLAGRLGVAVVLVEHLSKDSKRKGIYRVGGSIGVLGGARSGWFVVDDPQDPGRRLLLEGKNNYGKAAGLAFRVESSPENPTAPVVVWDAEPVTITLDEALQPPDADQAAGTAGGWLRARAARGGTGSEMATSGPRQYRGDTPAAERDLAGLVERPYPEARVVVGKRGARRYFHVDVLDVDGANAPDAPEGRVSPSTSTPSAPTDWTRGASNGAHGPDSGGDPWPPEVLADLAQAEQPEPTLKRWGAA